MNDAKLERSSVAAVTLDETWRLVPAIGTINATGGTVIVFEVAAEQPGSSPDQCFLVDDIALTRAGD